MPANPPGPYVTVSARSTPTTSGFTRPSGVGPRLLNDSRVAAEYQGAAPTANAPLFAVSAGLPIEPGV